MAVYQSPDRACIEFLKSTGQPGRGRAIRLAGVTPGMVPQQLYGAVEPPFWEGFMREVQVCADHHPYLVKPTQADLGRWAACSLIGAFLGFCCVDPDSGDYGAWHQVPQCHRAFCSAWTEAHAARLAKPLRLLSLGARAQELNALIGRWQPGFQQRGMALSFHHTRTMTWLQVDVLTRGKVATGFPA